MRIEIALGLVLAALLGGGCGNPADTNATSEATTDVLSSPAPLVVSSWNMKDKVEKTAEEWKQQLTPEEFRVLREEDTERAFTGALWNQHEDGIYRCAGCGLEVFSSQTKFDSGTGWPSFWQPINPGHVGTKTDRKLFTTRTEVHCARCDGHLGHIFEDGPAPTGLRYCINSVALTFEPKSATQPSPTPEAAAKSEVQ